MIRVTGWRGRVEDRVGWRKSTKDCSACAAAAYDDDDDDDDYEEEEI
jgi:hypothetical protein